MSIRDIRQDEAAEAFLKTGNYKGILNAAPRFGKIRVAMKIMNSLNSQRVLISYPREDIKEGWNADFKLLGFDEKRIEFVTFRSLKHKIGNPYDLLIIDEINEMSVNQLQIADDIVAKTNTLGLSGTITKKTENEILQHIGVPIVFRYSIEQAVEEGILCDYEINIHRVRLDNKVKIYTKNTRSEKVQFDKIAYAKEEAKGMSKNILELKQISIIQNSLSKINKTKELINKYEDQRLLIFTGLIEVANKFETHVYHSKIKDKQLFLDFCRGIHYKHLVTINMMQAGITIKPINRGIINYITGSPETTAQKISRFLGFEYDNPEKKAYIDLVSSNEPFEMQRISMALSFFNTDKIKYT